MFSSSFFYFSDKKEVQDSAGLSSVTLDEPPWWALIAHLQNTPWNIF